MRREISVLFACLGVLMLSAAPAQAQGAWLPSTVASGSALPIESADVAIGTGGHAAVVWARTHGHSYPYFSAVQMKRRTPSGVWGPIEDVTVPRVDPYAPDFGPYSQYKRPKVAVDAAGNTLVVFVTSGGTAPKANGNLYLQAYAPVGQPVGPQEIFASDANGSGGDAFADVHFGPSGEALITWDEVDEQLHSVVRRPDGTFAPETVIPNSEPDSNIGYDIAHGRDGSAVITWTEQIHVIDHWNYRAWASVRRPGGTWSAPQQLAETTDGDDWGFFTQVAVARDGSATVVLHNSTPAGPLALQTAALPKDGSTFGPLRGLPELDNTLRLCDLVADEPGRAAILGFEKETYGPKRAYVADVTSVAAPSTVEALGTSEMRLGWGCTEVAGACDTAGGLHFAWFGSPGASTTIGPARAFRAFRPAGATGFGPVQDLSEGWGWTTGLVLDAGAPGDALSAWLGGNDRYDQRLMLSRFDGAATAPTPVATATPVPTPTTVATAAPAPTTAPVATPTPAPAPTLTPVATETPTPTSTPVAAPLVGPVPSPEPARSTAVTGAETPQGVPSTVPPVPVSPTPVAQPVIVSSALKRLAVSAPGAGCTIPSVRGLTIAQAKRRLERANCRLGKVRYVRAGRSGRVVRQNTVGAARAAGFPVVIVVARPGR